MRTSLSLLLSMFLAFPISASAEIIKTSIGDLDIPEGLQILDRDEKIDPVTGKAGGIIVFTKANDMPRAIFIFTYVYAESSKEPFDALDAAVKIGNPFDTSLTSKDAKSVKVGGIDGGRYEGTLPNGLRAVGYAVENNSYRVVVLLKGPAGNPYKTLTNGFAQAVEKFVWKMPEAQAVVAP